MYIKLETTRLEYFRKEQSNFRREVYQGIVDSVSSGECRGDRIGQRILLPSSFIGGPRDMKKRYMDAMALVQHFGRPDLFITMTCNPDWIEIQQELRPGQIPQDRPDLVTRVFRAKLQDLKEQIFKKEIFGIVVAHVFVVEFQKRGQPHIHLLLKLKEGHNIKSVLDAIHLHLLGITKDIEEGHNNQNSVLLYVCTLSAHEQLFLVQKVYLDCFHRSKLLL